MKNFWLGVALTLVSVWSLETFGQAGSVTLPHDHSSLATGGTFDSIRLTDMISEGESYITELANDWGSTGYGPGLYMEYKRESGPTSDMWENYLYPWGELEFWYDNNTDNERSTFSYGWWGFRANLREAGTVKHKIDLAMSSGSLRFFSGHSNWSGALTGTSIGANGSITLKGPNAGLLMGLVSADYTDVSPGTIIVSRKDPYHHTIIGENITGNDGSSHYILSSKELMFAGPGGYSALSPTGLVIKGRAVEAPWTAFLSPEWEGFSTPRGPVTKAAALRRINNQCTINIPERMTEKSAGNTLAWTTPIQDNCRPNHTQWASVIVIDEVERPGYAEITSDGLVRFYMVEVDGNKISLRSDTFTETATKGLAGQSITYYVDRAQL